MSSLTRTKILPAFGDSCRPYLRRCLQVMPESSSAHDQLAAIAEASFRAYLARLQGGGGSSSSSQVPMDGLHGFWHWLITHDPFTPGCASLQMPYPCHDCGCSCRMRLRIWQPARVHWLLSWQRCCPPTRRRTRRSWCSGGCSRCSQHFRGSGGTPRSAGSSRRSGKRAPRGRRAPSGTAHPLLQCSDRLCSTYRSLALQFSQVSTKSIPISVQHALACTSYSNIPADGSCRYAALSLRADPAVM